MKKDIYKILENDASNTHMPSIQIVDKQVAKYDRMSKVRSNIYKIQKKEIIQRFMNNIYYNELDKFNKKKHTMFLDRKAFTKYTSLRGIADERHKKAVVLF